MWIKVAGYLISNPRLLIKILFGVLFLLLFLIAAIVAPMSFFLSQPMATSSAIDIYARGTDLAETATEDNYYGRLEINPMDVLVISSVIRKQDFSSASVRRVRDLARNFIEFERWHTVYVKTGYEYVYDEEGNVIDQTPIYESEEHPVYRIRSIEEVMISLGFTDEEKNWAFAMSGGGQAFMNPTGIGDGVTLNWWTDVRYIFPRGMEVTVTDVTTGQSFRMRRTGGRNHADSEPVTMQDAMTIFNVWGGWSWDRRPVTVHLNGQQIAASMNGMPHGFDSIFANGMQGHVCIHFLHSWTHLNNRECIEHQAMVLRASGAILDRFVRGADAYDFSPETDPDVVLPIR